MTRKSGAESEMPAPLERANPLKAVVPWVALCKPRVISLVIFSAMATAGPLLNLQNWAQFFALTLVITLGSSAGAVFNMYFDHARDASMERTAKRPIPQHLVTRRQALIFGWILASLAVLAAGVFGSLLSAVLLAFAIFFYGYFYSYYLKPRTDQNIVIGGIGGALPPLVFWVGMGGGLFDLLPWAVVIVITCWTPSHFWALALRRADDYAAAEVPVLPNTKGVKATERAILFYAIITLFGSYLPLLAIVLPQPAPGLLFLVAVTVLNVGLLLSARRLMRGAEPIKHFFATIWYLFFFLLVIPIDSWIHLPIQTGIGL